jgi:hypothetical protein
LAEPSENMLTSREGKELGDGVYHISNDADVLKPQ